MRKPLFALATVALCGATVALAATYEASAPYPIQTLTLDNGRHDCSSVELSAHADADTIEAALTDAAALAGDAGCVRIVTTETYGRHVHNVTLANDMEG